MPSSADDAREDAAIEIRTALLQKARDLGQPSGPRGPNPFFYDSEKKTQARSLGYDALIGLHSVSLEGAERQILALLRALDRHNCDDFEGIADLWQEILEIAYEEFKENAERADAA